MQKIENVGNLPNHLQIFARAAKGQFSGLGDTEFYEMANITEFEHAACGKLDPNVAFEIIPTVDMETGRGFLVGFEAEEPKSIVTLTSYVKLKLYFIACTDEEIKKWTIRIEGDRLAQQQEMFNRQERRKKKKLITKKEPK